MDKESNYYSAKALELAILAELSATMLSSIMLADLYMMVLVNLSAIIA